MYKRIKDLSIEEFVGMIMEHRENADAFELLKKEYDEAERSIRKEESVYWKEMLGVLSFAMNYPAKYLSAEDMLRLKKVLMPLISVVIAYIPQSSCKELMALHGAGILELITAGQDSDAVPHEEEGALYRYDEENATHFKTFIDCTGQPHLSYDEFPFASMLSNGTVKPAMIKFRSAPDKNTGADEKDLVRKKDDYFLKVPGIAIDDHFRVLGEEGDPNQRIYMMAVPFMGGFNPDYSGLDFCEEASKRIGEVIFSNQQL